MTKPTTADVGTVLKMRKIMKHTIHFAILGCGMISSVHADSIRAIPDAELVGVFDMSEERCRSFALRYGVIAYDSMDALLNDKNADAVCICTPSGFHADNAITVIKAGKHVLVEKPLALNTDDCDRLIEAAAEYGVKGGVMSQLRFADTTKILKSLVENGELGRVVTADIIMKYHRSPEYFAKSPWRGTWKHDGGGALMNQGIHGIDLLLSIMGKAKSVYGMARTLRHSIEVEDTAAAVVEFENGALGMIQGTTSVSPGYPRVLTVSGTKGTVAITENRFTEWSVPDKPLPNGMQLGGEIISGAQNPTDISCEGHIAQIKDFVDAILGNREPLVSFADGRRTVEMITAIYESSQNNCAIQLNTHEK